MLIEIKTLIFTLFIMLALNFIAQKLIVNSREFNKKRFFLTSSIQSIVISLLLIYVF